MISLNLIVSVLILCNQPSAQCLSQVLQMHTLRTPDGHRFQFSLLEAIFGTIQISYPRLTVDELLRNSVVWQGLIPLQWELLNCDQFCAWYRTNSDNILPYIYTIHLASVLPLWNLASHTSFDLSLNIISCSAFKLVWVVLLSHVTPNYISFIWLRETSQD